MDDLLIAPWERLASSRAEMARAEGISIRTLQRRLKADREKMAEELRKLDRFDHEYMELVGAPPLNGSAHEWATESTPESSRPRGTYHVGGRVKLLQGGVITTDDTSRTDGKPQPTAYQPDPLLKGGVG